MMNKDRLTLLLVLLALCYVASWFKLMIWTSRTHGQMIPQLTWSVDSNNYSSNRQSGSISTHQPLFSKDEINPHNYHFLITNEQACAPLQNRSVFLVMLVKSGISDIFDRQQIRRTWGGDRVVNGHRTLTMFLLGTTMNKTMDQRVYTENNQYKDIIQEDFLDSYQNLTIKNMMGLKWITSYCSNVSYVASVDSDVMLNVFNLVQRLRNKPRQYFAEGSLRKNAKPVRDNNGDSRKWFTSVDVYPHATYAPFLPGSCYVMSCDVAINIFHESSHVRFLPWDDVFVGLVMKRIGVTPVLGKGYERYLSKYENHTIKWTLKHAIAVLISHQKRKVDERLIELWHSVATMQTSDKFDTSDIFLVFVAVFCILFVYLIIATVLLVKCCQDGKDFEDDESDDDIRR